MITCFHSVFLTSDQWSKCTLLQYAIWNESPALKDTCPSISIYSIQAIAWLHSCVFSPLSLWLHLPLKFGLILASYPDTFPMSLSKNSEGGIGEAAFLAAACWDAAKLRNKIEKQRQVCYEICPLFQPFFFVYRVDYTNELSWYVFG